MCARNGLTCIAHTKPFIRKSECSLLGASVTQVVTQRLMKLQSKGNVTQLRAELLVKRRKRAPPPQEAWEVVRARGHLDEVRYTLSTNSLLFFRTVCFISLPPKDMGKPKMVLLRARMGFCVEVNQISCQSKRWCT